MKKNKISKNWIIRQKRDIFVRQSKIEGYRSRAIYKLKEIDEKFIIRKLLDIYRVPIFRNQLEVQVGSVTINHETIQNE